MATIVAKASVDGYSIEIDYDDVSMKVTGFAINNWSNKRVLFEVLLPVTYEYYMPANTSLHVNIPVPKRPTWYYQTIPTPEGGEYTFKGGTEWRSRCVI